MYLDEGCFLAVAGLTRLQELCIHECTLDDEVMVPSWTGLAALTALTFLYLEYDADDPQEFPSFPLAFKHLQALRWLAIAGTGITNLPEGDGRWPYAQTMLPATHN